MKLVSKVLASGVFLALANSLANAQTAHERMAKGEHIGKILLTV